MTKYYRVRTQEQWDWLKNKLEIEDDLQVSNFPVTILYGDVICGIYKYHDDPEPLIEVSQMMEDSRMEDYVTIKGEDLKNVEMFCGNESKGNLREFWDISKVNIPKPLLYPKVPMSVAEKKEFDELKRHRGTVYGALDMIEDDYPKLYTRLFGNSSHEGENNAQNDFARAWADESLIEVFEPVKFKVKVPNSHSSYYFKSRYGKLQSTYEQLEDHRFQFTAEEIKHYHLDNDLFEKVEVKQ